MTNRNTKIVKQAKEKVRKEAHFKRVREKVEMIVLDFGLLIALICYPIVLAVISTENDSTFFSLIASIFSLITTISLEVWEWANLTSKTKSKNKSFHILQKIFKHKNIVMLMIPGLFTIFMIILCIINVPKINSYLPNIITTATFIIYFSVFYKRSFYQKKNVH